MKKLLAPVCLMVCLALPAMAANVTFIWDLSADDALLGADGGYRLYQSTSAGGPYGTSPVASTAAGVTTVTIPAPTGIGQYFYVLRAFKAALESDPSNEVSIIQKPRPPVLKSATQVASNPAVKPDTQMALRIEP